MADAQTPDAQTLHDDMVARLTASLDCEPSELVRAQVLRAVQLLGLAARMRNRAVKGEAVDFGEWSKLEEMAAEAINKLDIPAPAKPAQPLEVRFVNEKLVRLDDQELAQLERLADKLYGDSAPSGPEGLPVPSDIDPAIDELLEMNRQLHAMVNEANRLRSIAEQSEQTQKRLCDSALARCAELEAAAPATAKPEIAQQRAPEAQGEASGKPSNVITLDPRGNGSCAISAPLQDRYPLAHLDPVGKW
jgi:hypothetical protein